MKILKALSIEDECSLNYLYSYQIEQLDHIKNAKMKKGRSGRFARFAIYVIKTLIRSSRQKKEAPVDLMVFSGTKNQLNSLLPLVTELSKNESISFKHYISETLLKKIGNQGHSIWERSLGHSFIDALKSIYISLVRQRYLLSKRSSFHPHLFSYYYDKLLAAHTHLIRLFRLFDQATPRLVVMSNDHNLINRSLRLMAYYKNVPTAYLQHASVSPLFPALGFDYSFLDGEVALETYLKCEANKTTEARPKIRRIYLSGQKKEVRVESRTPKFVGIAVNTLDELPILLDLIEFLTGQDIEVKVRTHPAQSNDFLKSLEAYTSKNSYVSISRSTSDSLKNYFSSCYYLISGNSSIHLEAALAGVMTYYYEFSKKVQHSDYYGYVKRGLSSKWPHDFKRMGREELLEFCAAPPERTLSVKQFSETYGTKWEGREGQLVFETISRVLNQQSTEDLYQEDLTIRVEGLRVFRLLC